MVRIHNMIVAGKRRNEHNQRTFRKMEVGDQSVDALKRISGVDKDICPAIRFLDLAEKGRDAFERPAAGCADCDDPSAVFVGLIDQLCSFGGNMIMLRVHLMIQNIVLFDRPEGSKPDMERDLGDIDAHRSDLVHQLGCEMQAGSRRGGASFLFGVDRLIALFILKLFGDVRGERHLPDLVKDRVDIPRGGVAEAD